MTSPFDNKDATFFVLVNDEGQHSLWPEYVAIPEGWNAKFGPEAKERCLEFVKENWTDMRPRSLIETVH
ncbi:MbtH family protein [Trinickia mobilis]|uniref:MbtH family protein n=1 Tax=Trinickia mobilis TaxID=2816356 RepID=UPI001A8C60DD|nr:MbtH family protein [Trinickia mobilis]